MNRRVELIFVLFMVSGFGGLIYESVWTHYLQLFLGHSAYAQTVVLVVFIGGLAVGSWACARFARRIKNPLRWYAGVELAVGAMALVFHPVFVAVTGWGYESLLPATCSSEHTFCATQWLVCALMLAPQSVLIGATFPLVSSAVLRMDPSAPGHHVATLYFVNSFGAVVGVMASAFVLIPAFGLPGTLAFAGAANIALALGAIALARVTPPAFAVRPLPVAVVEPEGTATRLMRVLLATAFLTGLSSFIYEIVWIRMLSLVLGASTYSFELMLASFILGLALGGRWIRQRLDSITDPVRFLGIVQILMGVAAAATLPLYNESFLFMSWLLSAVTRNTGGFIIFNVGSTAIALAVMLPATFCAGMTLPLITYRLLRSSQGERALGLVYSANTLGSIAGVILAVHVLFTLLGARGALIAGAAIDVLLGVVLIGMRAGRRRLPSWVPAVVGLGAIVLIVVAFPIDPRRAASGVFRSGEARLPSLAQIVFHEDGKTATVDVMSDGQIKAIRTNGKTDAAISVDNGPSTADELTMMMLSVLPLAHSPQARTAALIGFGSGMSTDAMLRSPNIRRVDTIEIEPAMVRGAREFLPIVQAAFDDPRSHIVIDDAKSYFARGRQRYDIIVSEPSNPWVSGVASLFTEEFYARLAESLNDGGVLSQWLHTYEIDPVALASIFNAVAKTFPDFVVYSTVDSDIVLIARKGGKVGAPDASVMQWPGVAKMLARLEVHDAEALTRRSVGSSASIMALFGPMGVPANSDYRPLLEQRASRTRFTQERVTDLTSLQMAKLPLLEMFDGTFQPADHPLNTHVWAASDRAAADAWFFRDLVMDPSAAPGPAPPIEGREHAGRLVGLWASSCPATPSFDRLLPSLVALAEMVTPNMAAKPATEMWQHIATSPCARKLAPGEHAWLDLFVAVAARDGAKMGAVGRSILDAHPKSAGPTFEYAFMATVAGLTCSGDRADANRYFERGVHEWQVPGDPPLELRYLYGVANLPPGSGRPHSPLCAGAS